jgi:hypothetical protein
MLVALDSVVATYLRSQAEATHQTPAQVIGNMVLKELTQSA